MRSLVAAGLRRPPTTPGRLAAKAGAVLHDVAAGQGAMRSGRRTLAAHLFHERASALVGGWWSGAPARLRSRGGTTIHYRANPGDLRSLREVWLEDVYRLPGNWNPRTVLDLGANIGLTSLWYHEQWPDATYLLVEPDPGNVEVARRNLVENQVDGQVVAAAVGPMEGTARFATDTSSNVGHLSGDGDVAVDVVTVHHLLEMLGGRADLVKLDVEGGEAAILAEHTSGWLDQVSVLVAEFHPPQVDYPALVAGIVRQGFVHFPPNTLRPRSTDLFFHPDRVPAIDRWIAEWSASQHDGGGAQQVA